MGFKPVFPIIITVDKLNHPEYNKKIELWGDMHEKNLVQIMRMVGYSSNESFAKFIEVLNRQRLKIEDTITDMLERDNETQTCIITETDANLMACMFEQEGGFCESDELSDGCLSRIPRVLLRNVMKSGTTPQEKQQIFTENITALKTQNYLKDCRSMILDKTVSWVMGNSWRTEQDFCITHNVYFQREQIVNALQEDNSASLPDQIKKLSIDFVKNYISNLHNCFVSHELDDNHSSEILNIIDTLLEKTGLSPLRHMAELYTNLVNNGETDLMDYLNNKIIDCVSLIQDAELKHYMDAINKSSECDSVIIVAGAAHTELLKEILIREGYQEAKPHKGIQDSTNDLDIASGQGNLPWLKLYCEKALDQAPF